MLKLILILNISETQRDVIERTIQGYSEKHEAIWERKEERCREAENGTVPIGIGIRRRGRGIKSMIADRIERSSGCNRCRAAR